MRKVYTIQKFEQIHNDFYFSLHDSEQDIQIQPTGQVIVDSDNMAFIYIVEDEGTYSYLSFPQTTWPALVQIVEKKRDPFLTPDLALSNFAEELEYLLWNIQDNENYGKAFVEAVEAQFTSIYLESTD
ncbi:hypothetical protein MHH70_07840 [Metasolibacillus sp. FSL H7-0170]|uniref:UPF0738 family protein n=1 Tax=Metasolibacillus TaxID=2703677 RepID=UPI000825978F|nr:hypothetical protein [Metasolibacillus fluoroglycofenilyticus]